MIRRDRFDNPLKLACRTTAAILIVCLLLLSSSSCPAAFAVMSDLPEDSIKIPPMVPEESVSIYLPSDSAPGKGLAVNIIYPKTPRYADGAPIVVVAPGGSGPDGLGFEIHAAQVGFVEVRFAFPGGGHGKFTSSGIYDYRGVESQKALRDVLLFAAGKQRDSEGKQISDLLPGKVSRDNIGVVGWSNGGNIALVTMYKYADQLQFINWIAFYESPLGSLFFPPNLGGERDLVRNKHYRPGSCATGDCLVNYVGLAYDPFIVRTPGEHKKKGEAEIPGVLYFDENHNGKWDESIEFAFTYACDVGLDKQIYPPDLAAYLEHSQAFVQRVHVSPKRKPVKPEQTGVMAVIGPRDPTRRPIDPLATPLRVPSQSVSEATDKFAYFGSTSLLNAPPAAKNRKYYFRPVPPDVAEQIRIEAGGQPLQKKANRFIPNDEASAQREGNGAQKSAKVKSSGAADGQNDQKEGGEGASSSSTTSASTTEASQTSSPAEATPPGSGPDMASESDVTKPAASSDATGEQHDGQKIASNSPGQTDGTEPVSGDANSKDASASDQNADSSEKPESKPAKPAAPVVQKTPMTKKQMYAYTKFHTMHPIASNLPPKKPEKDLTIYKDMIAWPTCIATLKESEAYFEERDGSLYIAKIIEKFPNLLVMVCATEVDHLQRQVDHPHIALQYNAWLSNKARWLRLNPDYFYMAAASNMNKGNFKNNPPRSSIDASEIAIYLENEGVTPDYVFMEGAIAELADRKRTKNLKAVLTDVICPYTNPAFPLPPPPKKTADAPAK
jgi:hypothetical protein